MRMNELPGLYDAPATLRALSAPEPISNEAQLRDDFLAGALTKKMDDRLSVACTDSVSDVLTESLEYKSGPHLADVLELLCAVAKGEAKDAQAKQLLLRMATTWAFHNATVEYDDPVERFRMAEGGL